MNEVVSIKYSVFQFTCSFLNLFVYLYTDVVFKHVSYLPLEETVRAITLPFT